MSWANAAQLVSFGFSGSISIGFHWLLGLVFVAFLHVSLHVTPERTLQHISLRWKRKAAKNIQGSTDVVTRCFKQMVAELFLTSWCPGDRKGCPGPLSSKKILCRKGVLHFHLWWAGFFVFRNSGWLQTIFLQVDMDVPSVFWNTGLMLACTAVIVQLRVQHPTKHKPVWR